MEFILCSIEMNTKKKKKEKKRGQVGDAFAVR